MTLCAASDAVGMRATVSVTVKTKRTMGQIIRRLQARDDADKVAFSGNSVRIARSTDTSPCGVPKHQILFDAVSSSRHEPRLPSMPVHARSFAVVAAALSLFGLALRAQQVPAAIYTDQPHDAQHPAR